MIYNDGSSQNFVGYFWKNDCNVKFTIVVIFIYLYIFKDENLF